MLKSKFRIAVALAATATAGMSFAQAKFYVGGSIGATFASGNYGEQVRGAGPPFPDFTLISAGRDGSGDIGGRLAIGYRVAENISIELGYANFGAQDVSYQFEKTSGLIPTERFFSASGRLKLDGATLDVIGTVPLSKAISFNARVGLMASKLRYSEVRTFLNQGVDNFTKNDNFTNLHWGVGATYRVNDALGVTLDYTQAQSVGKRFAWTEEGNGRLSYGLLALGVRYNF